MGWAYSVNHPVYYDNINYYIITDITILVSTLCKIKALWLGIII